MFPVESQDKDPPPFLVPCHSCAVVHRGASSSLGSAEGKPQSPAVPTLGVLPEYSEQIQAPVGYSRKHNIFHFIIAEK